jgi:hypothetical protein
MFLPVLLVRDLGFWGWVVFAVPNVIGAAAMGWVLRTPESSRRIVDSHGPACRAFSAVTIALHVFFVLWFVPRLVGLPIAACTFALVAIYLLLTMTRPGLDLLAGFIALALSLVLLVIFVHRTEIWLPPDGPRPRIDLLWLSPVCIFGFALCPYLDLTFHRARQRQPTLARSRTVFSIGFGVCFLAMIVFSLLYADFLSPLLAPDWRGTIRPVIGWILATHMIMQSAFTLSVHARSLASSRLTPSGLFALLLLTQVALFAALGCNFLPRYHNLDPGEVIYRLFMAFYGLIFPAYVWICIVSSGPTAASVRALILAIVVASPMYWMGFIEGQMIWLVPGVAAVLVAPLAARLPISGQRWTY